MVPVVIARGTSDSEEGVKDLVVLQLEFSLRDPSVRGTWQLAVRREFLLVEPTCGCIDRWLPGSLKRHQFSCERGAGCVEEFVPRN